jgi:hypothetical protein
VTTLQSSLLVLGIVVVGLGSLAVLLSLLHRLGSVGRAVSRFATRTPGLDLVVSVFTWMPWVLGPVVAGWWGLLAAVVGQYVTLLGWVTFHELLHRHTPGRRTIDRFINRTVGKFRNHLALYVTVVALPGFLLVRLLQIVAYPWLVWLLGFPRYRHAEWINCSRQKFDGLVGHDLVWCLYCDWMTGVYALGGEMLRNVESFWCPIRFYDGKKCENCRTDFPDIEHGWVPASGTMQDVGAKLEEMYGDGRREWFGHPARLTVKGEPVEERGK